jgi:large subunit ribosomal protein L54
MICRACLRAPRPSFLPRRFLTTSPHLSNTTLSTPASSQPLSAPFTPSGSPDVKAHAADAAKKKPAVLVKSSVAAGTPLKGLNFEKNKQDPVALPDEEYPEWLWGILAKGKEDVEGVGGMGDLFCKNLSFIERLGRWQLTLLLTSQIQKTATCRRQAPAQRTSPAPGAASPESAAVRTDD